MDAREHAVPRFPWRLATRLAPIAVALLLAWSYSDSFLHPTFFGDQGLRLDHADELVFDAGPRIWLPFLQLHIHALYRLHAPVGAFLLVPYAYTVLSLFLLVALCRAALRDERAAFLASALLLIAFAGASFQWLGRSLYQEVIVIPLFLALVYLFYFAPQRRGVFIVVLAVGMLTREVFWIWWLAFLALHWRGRLRDLRLRAGVAALGAIPVAWLVWTGQSPLLTRDVGEKPILFEGLGRRATIFGAQLVSESLLPLIVLLAVIFAVVLRKRGVRGLSFRGYHVFSLVSLAAIYGYVLLFRPFQVTAENTRMLVPLYAHLLFWAIVAWRDASQLDGRVSTATRIVCAVGVLSLLKVHAIVAVLGGATPRTGALWEPLHLTTRLDGQDDWRTAVGGALLPLRNERATRLNVVFVDVPKEEYLKFWVAPFLYDARTLSGGGTSLTAADVVVVPAEAQIPSFVRRERLQLPGGIVRDVLVRER
jgi:hypothetical protein